MKSRSDRPGFYFMALRSLSIRQVIFFIALSAGAFFGGFLLTLQLTEPEDTRPVLERLSSQKISDYSELISAARAAGLCMSERLRGSVESISRTNERDVMIAGWLADPEGDATPLDIIVFVAGPMVAKTRTKGERPDVTRAWHLYFGSEKNVSFQVSFSCRAGDQPIIVGLGNDKQLFPLVSSRCP